MSEGSGGNEIRTNLLKCDLWLNLNLYYMVRLGLRSPIASSWVFTPHSGGIKR